MFIGTKSFTRSLQLDNFSCGARSIYSVLRHFGVHRPYGVLKADLGTRPASGTAVHAMIRVLRVNGLRVGYRPRWSWRSLMKALSVHAVVIVHLDGDHLGVVHGADDQRIYLADPSIIRCPGRSQPRQKFLSRWTRWGLVVRRSTGAASRRP